MKITDRRTGGNLHAYVQSIDLNLDGNYVMRYIIGIENYQGFQFLFSIYSNEEFNQKFQVVDEEVGKTPGWVAREAKISRETNRSRPNPVYDSDTEKFRKGNQWMKNYKKFMIRMVGLYGDESREAWYESTGDCFNFAPKKEFGTIFNDSDTVLKIVKNEKFYLRQFNAKKMEIIPVE